MICPENITEHNSTMEIPGGALRHTKKTRYSEVSLSGQKATRTCLLAQGQEEVTLHWDERGEPELVHEAKNIPIFFFFQTNKTKTDLSNSCHAYLSTCSLSA